MVGGKKNITGSKHHLGETAVEDCAKHPTRTPMCLFATGIRNNCFKELTVDYNKPDQINKAIKQLKKNNFTFVLLSGERHQLQLFQQKAGIEDYIMSDLFVLWYVKKTQGKFEFNTPPQSYYAADVILNVPGAFAVNKFLHYAQSLSHQLTKTSFWKSLLKQKEIQLLICDVLSAILRFYSCPKPFTIEHWKRLPHKNYIIERLKSDRRIYKAYISVWKQGFYIKNINITKLMNQTIFNPKQALERTPHCNDTKPLCIAGQKLVHSFYKETNWTRSLGWICEKCSAGQFKQHAGNNETCIPCPPPLITDTNRTCLLYTSPSPRDS